MSWSLNEYFVHRSWVFRGVDKRPFDRRKHKQELDALRSLLAVLFRRQPGQGHFAGRDPEP
jgi:hypothetical protein